MRIALAQINPTVGDIANNAKLAHQEIIRAQQASADLVVFPELAIVGYPPRDLLLKPDVIEGCKEAVHELASACTETAALIGYPCLSGASKGMPLHNAAALCHQGKVIHHWIKTLLPTYDVFDERRYFEPGRDTKPVAHRGVQIGVTICEDLWNDRELFARQLYHDDPIANLARMGAELLINCSASPFVVGKHPFRLRLLQAAATRHRLPLIFCNQVGGNDELVFDGNSCVIGPDGKIIAHAKDFQPELLIADVPLPGVAQAEDRARQPITERIHTPTTGTESAYYALVLGLRDYCNKCGFSSIVLGLSGGIDSAVTAALCVAALGPENVTGVAMPSRYSSQHSVDDARELARRLDIQLHTIPIGLVHETLEQVLEPIFDGRPSDTTEENIQARVRGVVLMSLSNKFGSLLVTTGNKSELAVGYCTLYGDMCGGLAALSDVPKTMVWDLARWINDSPSSPLRLRYGGPIIPESSITKPPSAELRPDQTDQDSLPPYEVLDTIIERYIEHEQPARQIIADLATQGVEAETVLRVTRLIDRNEYKRKQAAPGLKITGRAFGFGRRMPIAQRFTNT